MKQAPSFASSWQHTRENERRIAQGLFAGLIGGFLLAPLLGPIAGLHMGLTCAIAPFLLAAVRHADATHSWHVFACKWTTPLALWVTFGIGAVPAYIRVSDLASYGLYEDLAVLTFSLYVLLAAISYITAFTLVTTGAYPRITQMTTRFRENVRIPFSVLVCLGILLVFDWWVRLDQMLHGSYFTWLRPRLADVQAYTTNTLYHLNGTSSWIALALLIGLAGLRSPFSRLFRILAAAQLLLVFSAGDRLPFLTALALSGFAYLYVKRVRLTRRYVAIALGVLVLFFGVVNPAIQAGRIMMLREASVLRHQPQRIPLIFVSEYLPQALGLKARSSRDWAEIQGQSVPARLGGYVAYGAAINQAIMDGRRPIRGLSESIRYLSVLVPRVFLPSKAPLAAGPDLLRYFGLGYKGLDPNGTHLADMFSFLHLPGMIVLLGLGGSFYGLFSRFLMARFRFLGGLILIGMLPAFLPYADSFAAYLVGMRNSLIVCTFLAMAFPSAATIRRHFELN